ncbi:MAG TPA: tetratricopeptide repeat protein [Myxococcaceae bacterium]|nr:tetratricopeptide repeat protein [Myxococcaceae bacterium]
MRLHVLPLVLACGCATDVASRGDVQALTEQVQALQRENAQLERRVQTLEQERALEASPAAKRTADARAEAAPAVASVAAPTPAPVDALPELTVVKLKPKTQAAPPLDVHMPVQEPEAVVREELEAAAEASSPAASGSVDQEYLAGLEALRTGNVGGGIERLKRFADAYPRHPKADDALYYAALGELGRGDPARAAKLLELVVQRYPAGDVVQDAMLKLGEVHLRLRQPAEARATYALLVQNFPGTAAAAQAQVRLSTLPRNP